MSRGNPAVAQLWVNYAIQYIQPAFQYYNEKFNAADTPLRPFVMIFKSCQLFHPAKASDMRLSASAVCEMCCIPFLDSNEVIQQLQSELPTYLTIAEGTAGDTDVPQWWARHAREENHWASACSKILLLQPSSATSERVFSLLQSLFSDRKESALEDYIETSLMLQYNSE